MYANAACSISVCAQSSREPKSFSRVDPLLAVEPVARRASHALCSDFQAVQKEITRDDWARYFETFTTEHNHWLVSVDGERETMPLEGITARDSRIVVTLGGNIEHHRRIVIDGASVRVEQSGGNESLEIESTDGHVTRLRVLAPDTEIS